LLRVAFAGKLKIMKTNGAHPGWHGLGVFMVVGWLVALGLNYQRPSGSAARPLESLVAAAELSREEGWFGLYLGGKKAGWLHQKLEPHPAGYRLLQESLLQVALDKITYQIKSMLTASGGKEGELRQFDLQISGPVEMNLAGLWHEGRLELSGAFHGEKFSRTLELARPALVELLLPQLLARQELAPGERYSVETFDPQNLVQSRLTVEVQGLEALKTTQGLRQVYRVKVLERNQQLWLDAAGRLWREESEEGFLLVREDEKSAQLLEGSAEGNELLRNLGKFLEGASRQ